MKNSSIILFFCWSVSIHAQPCGSRYFSDQFTQVNKTTTQFDVQPNYLNVSTPLLADIYTPVGDTETDRAAIIFVHGGGFVGGTRDGSNIQVMCNSLARKGYVVASIDYRLGVADASVEEKGRAQIRAVQDLNSFIRYAKDNATTVNIDVNRLFLAGSSAGGATVLASSYLEYNERPAYMDTSGVGAFNGYGNLNGQSSETAAVFSMWGAVTDTNWIQAGDIPVGCIQSVDDACIPWEYQPSSCNVPGYQVFGSFSINQRATSLGIYSRLYGFTSSEHDYGLDNLIGLDTTIAEMTAFYYNVLCGLTSTSELKETHTIKAYPNPSNGRVRLELASIDKGTITVFNAFGKQVLNRQFNGSAIDLQLPVTSGLYTIRIAHVDGSIEHLQVVNEE